MTPSVAELGLDRLAPEEPLAVAEALWESVVEELSNAPLSPAQQAELERRYADSIAQPDDVISWEEVRARALARLRK